jgi:hypothetical protein
MSEEGLQALSDACPETEMAAGEAPGRCDTVPEREIERQGGRQSERDSAWSPIRTSHRTLH